jgi:3-oxoacyl-[acyl-carrier protein] reductase
MTYYKNSPQMAGADEGTTFREPFLVKSSPSVFADFDKIQPGDEAQFEKTISAEDVDSFAIISGDSNPLHMDEDFARRTNFGRRVVHGMLLASYVSTLVGTHCPGSGALWSQQSFRWQAPVFIGDRIHLKLVVKHKSTGSRSLAIAIKGFNQHREVFMDGEGVVSVLEERLTKRDAPINERIVLVTGATHEIGTAISLALARAGATVVVNYRNNVVAAEELCALLEAAGGKAMAICADLADANAIQLGVRQIQEKLQTPIDLLINAAGSFPELRPFMEMTWAEMQATVESHLGATFNCCQAVIPGMTERKSGRIINIGSAFLHTTPMANWSSFLIAKAAVQTLTRSLAVELGPLGIRVNMVSPGLLEAEAGVELPNRFRKVQAMQTPLRRLASPADVAAVVLALSSAAGEFITGADIPVCGGMSI